MNENCDINEPSNRTKYTYDALDDLTSVVQKGGSASGNWRTRGFSYDPLGRLLTAANPESGTITYTYDPNGNLSTKTDARNITITYSYDNLNRLTGKSYSDGITPTATFGYDFNPNLGGSNYIGRLTGTAVSSSGYALYSRTMIGYDAMGRPQGYIACTNNTWVCTDNQTPIDTAWYLYDLAGNTAELVTAFVASDTQAPVTGRIFTYDGAGRLSSVAAGEGNGGVNSFTTLLSGAVYDAAGQMTGANLAIDPNTQQAEFSLSRSYDHRLRILSETDTSQSRGPIYNYSIPSPPTATTGYAPNGNLVSYTDSELGQQIAVANGSPCYDSLNRLTCLTGISDATVAMSWTYDPWGNRTAQNVTVTGNPTFPVPSNQWANYGTNNQVTSASSSPAGFEYDGAGNVLSDGSNQYAYDGEGRLCAMYNSLTTTVTIYLYDASGYRVVKGTVSGQSLPLTSAACNYYAAILNGFSPAELYVVGLDGTALDEVDQNGNLLHSNVLANGELLATYLPSNSEWVYNFNDRLGTKRAAASADGTVWELCGGDAFGDDLNCIGTTDPSEQHFTGKERDTESGNDYFGARYYGSSMGRFMSPDWSNNFDPVPYAKLDNPQSLNLYSYVENNPLTRVDEDGHAGAQSAAVGGEQARAACAAGADCQMQADGTLTFQGSPVATNEFGIQAQQQSTNQAVGNTTEGALAKVLTNEIGSLSTPKGGDANQLQDGSEALANALINNANKKKPNAVAPDTGTASPDLADAMQSAVTARANGAADPVEGRTFYGTSHTPPDKLHSRPIGNGRQSVYESFGPFKDSTSKQQTYIYIYNDPGQ